MQYITIKTYIMKALLTTLILFLSLTNSYSTNYYIATTGSDANTGTSSATAKLTLSNVFSTKNLASGDTIFIAAGTYSDKTITVGSDDEAFVIQGAPLSNGLPTTVYDSDQTSYWLRFNNANNDNININNIKLKDYKGGAYNGGAIRIGLGVDGITGTKVNNCQFENCDTESSKGGGAIYASSSSSSTLAISGCQFDGCDAGTAGGGAIYVEYSGMASGDLDITINKCKFSGNSSNGHGSAIFINGFSGSTINITNCLIYNNQCKSSSANGVVYTNLYSTMSMTNCTIYGNTALSSPSVQTGGLYLFGGGITANTATISNCISYGNSNYDIYEANGTVNVNNSCYQNQYSINSTSCTTLNPQFADAAAADFTLLSTSPCINTGNNTGSPTSDYTGTNREGTTDMGALEYITPTAMPIALLSFDARYEDGKIHTKWITASETNVDYYAVEYSKNAVDFIELCRLKSIGNSSEIKTHECSETFLEKSDIVYIRLKEVDYDGYVEYFKIIGIVIELKTKTIIGIYNLRGNEASMDDPGLLIVKYSDGSFQKIVKR